MWKRLNNSKGARQPGISAPIETTFEEKAYAGSTGLGINVNRPKSPPNRNMPPQRPRRDDDTPKGLPRLPFEPAPPPAPEHRDSTFRPASSIYSQPSPNNPVTTRFPRTSYANPSTTYTEEVSPPSSPEFGAQKKSSQAQYSNDQEVSPINEMPDSLPLGTGRPSSRPGSSSKPPSSNIPVLRREKRRNQVAAAAANLVTRKEIGGAQKGGKIVDVRWDPYSGEQTTSEKGKPQSVKPGEFTPPGLRSIQGSTSTALGNESSITAAPKPHTSFGERVRKLKGSNEPTERPEWKGATGRQTLVSPVADQIDIPTLNIPRKSSKRVASPHSGRSRSSTPVTVIRSGETSPASAQPIEPTMRSIVSNSGRNSPRILTSPTSIPPETVSPPNAAARTQNSGNTLPSNLPSHEKDSTGTIERNFREALKDVSFAAGDLSDPYVPPPSRFSVTTYAPSEAHSTPRPSIDTYDRPPMPTPPQTYTITQQPSPVINRKRPKVAESPKTTTRKAVNSSSPVFISMSSSVASKRASNVGKNLPQSPAEAQSHDLVTSLEAQLDNLAHRRHNITKSIRQMTELMPTDSVIANEEVRRKREEEKRKVEMLRVEEADVKREEHEIGLRLHRAWKRRDKDAVYEPTGLWVRRVTG